MSRVAPIELNDRERESLQAIIRERDRAETLLLLVSGESVKTVAERQGLCREAVRIRRRKWLKFGLASLGDQSRSGAPSKLDDAQRRQLGAWVEAEALGSRELLTRLEHECGVVIGRTTLRTELKALGYVWKRTRYSLKKARPTGVRTSPRRDRRFDRTSAGGRNRTGLRGRGGLCATTTEPLGLGQEGRDPRRGGEAVATAKRHRRVAVVGAAGHGQPVAERQRAMVFRFPHGLGRTSHETNSGVFDNASFHTANALGPYWELLKEKGMRLYFLPPYSPELKGIEILWKKMKYGWLPFKTFTPDELEQAIDKIGTGFGSEYKLTFC